jgi:MFS family permease
MRKPERDCLWIILFFIVFINGFEAGGYQASLWSVGKDFDLSMSSMGLFAAMELFATMLAPILLGRWADGVEKLKGIGLLLCLQIAAALIVLFAKSDMIFLIAIFSWGLRRARFNSFPLPPWPTRTPSAAEKKSRI